MSQDERKELEANLNHEAGQAVRLFYLSRQFVYNEKIPVTQQEVQNEAVSIFQSHGNRNVDMDQMPRELYALALSKIILAKAQDFVLNYQKP